MTKTFVTKIDPSKITLLKEELTQQEFSFTIPQYTLFQAKKSSLSVTLYSSLTLVVQGKGMNDFIEFYLEPYILQELSYTYKKNAVAAEKYDLTPKIGSDEAGKGDFFGPLVVASVYSRGEDDISWLMKSEVKDSKLLSEKSILQIAKKIESYLPHEIITLSPQKYNDLYASFLNLNDLLAWCHAEAISSLAKRVSPQKILVDKFAAEHVLIKALVKKNISISLVEQRVRAEEDIVVAAASILARARFVGEMERLSRQIGITLPKGASSQVITTGQNIVKKYTPEILFQYAKYHFSTTDKVLQNTIRNVE